MTKKLEGRVPSLGDIRYRKWMEGNTYVAQVVRLLIAADDILSDLDDFQIHESDNYFCYFEDFELQVDSIIHDFIKYVDDHEKVLYIDDKVDEVVGNKK